MARVPGMRVPPPSGAIARRSDIPPVSHPRSVFPMVFRHKSSMNTGKVYPVLCAEVLPGDTWKMRSTILSRLTTLLFPIMDDLWMDVHVFFEPWRLIWENTEKFFGQQANPADSVAFTIPQTGSGFMQKGCVQDYMGATPWTTNPGVVNALQVRGYEDIWNKWYRDQNTQNSVAVSTGDGPDAITGHVPLPRGKRGDRFTRALPWPQKGTAVSFLPDNVAVTPNSVAIPKFRNAGSTVTGGELFATATNTSPPVGVTSPVGDWTVSQSLVWDQPNLEVDFATLGVATINAWRMAYATQGYLERQGRGGTFYPQYLKRGWGVTSSDARLQRPEFITGASRMVMVSPIAQQSASDPAVTPQGNLSGVAAGFADDIGFVQSFEEHGFLYVMVSFRSDYTYQEGIQRQWFRRTVYDVADPAFAHIGDQPIYQKELFWDGSNNSQVFGYEGRYDEYRHGYSWCSADMRSQAGAQSFDAWHLAQEFGTAPTLNAAFIEENPPMDRILAVDMSVSYQWIVDMKFDCEVARVLPLHGVPSMKAVL